MGLIKAALGSVGGILADQWREYFYCDSLPENVLVTKGKKRVSGRSSNTRGVDNIISNGSVIAVSEGQCMIIVEQGKVVDLCAEPGEYLYDVSTEPSIFYGGLGPGIRETFRNIGKRFSFGGEAPKDQRIYYFNTKEIMGNKFGTPTPILFEVVNKRIGIARTVQIRCNGMYSYVISDPMLFYSRICGNVTADFTRDQIDHQLKTEFIDALQPAFGALAELELRPAQIPAKVNALKAAMNNALKQEWIENRGITIEKIALNPISLSDEDMKKINQLEDAASMGSNPFMMAGRMNDATASAMEVAAANSAGAMTGFMGMGMVGQGSQGGFAAVQNLYQMGQQQMERQSAGAAANSWKCSCGTVAAGRFCPECGSRKPETRAANAWKCVCGNLANGKFCTECGAGRPAEDGWTCTCGAVNKGKFCPECGARKPAGVPQYKCDKCGWEPQKGEKPPRFCPECGDPFDGGDIV